MVSTIKSSETRYMNDGSYSCYVVTATIIHISYFTTFYTRVAVTAILEISILLLILSELYNRLGVVVMFCRPNCGWIIKGRSHRALLRLRYSHGQSFKLLNAYRYLLRSP